jgi:quinol monooxygenase YgiN
MYIRLTRASFDPARYEVVKELFQEVTDAMRTQPGFRDYYAAADRATGRVIAVSTWYWEDQAHLDRAALGNVIGRLQAAGVRLEDPEIYETIARA